MCGAGDAGMFCALAAAEAGAKVLLIDPMEQGFGIRCSALGAVDSKLQQSNGAAIDKMEIVNDVVRYADGVRDKYNKTHPNFAAGLNAGLCATMGRHVGKALAAK